MLMNRLNETESVVWRFCRFSLFQQVTFPDYLERLHGSVGFTDHEKAIHILTQGLYTVGNHW